MYIRISGSCFPPKTLKRIQPNVIRLKKTVITENLLIEVHKMISLSKKKSVFLKLSRHKLKYCLYRIQHIQKESVNVRYGYMYCDYFLFP